MRPGTLRVNPEWPSPRRACLPRKRVRKSHADVSGINTNPFKGVERFRLPASYFSLLVQRKVTKRKHLPRQIAQGVWVAKEFSDSASLPRSENGGHPWPPPLRGFRVLVAAAGLRKSKAPASPVSRRPPADGPISVFDRLDTAHAIRIRTPGGRPAWMPAVFGSSHGWRVRKWRQHRISPERC